MWVATVIESHLDSNLWPVATVLINTWTINSWDNIVCADSHWKVKILRNYANQKVKFALPWSPALIVWLDKIAMSSGIVLTARVTASASDLIEKRSGTRPVGYVAPWWEFSPITNELLVERGFLYDHSLMHNDHTPYYVRVGDSWTKINYEAESADRKSVV